MRVLFLHGWTSVPGGLKPTYLKEAGHEIINPALDDDDFDLAIRTAQAEYNQYQPDVIVGSSRGGAVAMNINSSDTPLVLLCPAWKRWGKDTTVKTKSVIVHSQDDEVIPFSDSEELLSNSGLPTFDVRHRNMQLPDDFSKSPRRSISHGLCKVTFPLKRRWPHPSGALSF